MSGLPVVVPPHLVTTFGHRDPEWVAGLPTLVEELAHRWDLTLDAPLGDPPGAAGWVASGVMAGGTEVFLKVGWPHPEARHEATGLRIFDGRGAVRLLASDDDHFALVTERVRPGDPLTDLAVDDGNRVAASVLQQLWREPGAGASVIEPLAETVRAWNDAYPTTRRAYPTALVAMATELGARLAETQPSAVLLHGDFNPTNVLRSEAHGWLAIDPKPLVGDPAYDLAQFLANRIDAARASGRPEDELVRQVHFFAETLDLDPTRVAGWAAVKAVGWNWGMDGATLLHHVHQRVAAA